MNSYYIGVFYLYTQVNNILANPPNENEVYAYPPSPSQLSNHQKINEINNSNPDVIFFISIIVILLIITFLNTLCNKCEGIVSTDEFTTVEDNTTVINNPSNQPRRSLNEVILISNIKRLINDECPICIEPFEENDELYQLKCNHIFHTKCISEWININNICPNCREVVITDV